MVIFHSLVSSLHNNRRIVSRLISILVGGHGLFIVAGTLHDELQVHHGPLLMTSIVVNVPLIVGFSLVYLASLLQRRKHRAWVVTVVAYAFYIGLSIAPLLSAIVSHHATVLLIARVVVLPAVIIGLLWVFREDFVVRSDRQGFQSALRFSCFVLLAAFIFGTSGFVLLSQSDFHQEIQPLEAAHYTIDQFNLTTTHPVQPHTKRAHLFVDSLSLASTAAVVYVVIALFQPLRSRLGDQTGNREAIEQLMHTHKSPSEDYFKLWPHDKQYFFSRDETSGLAYRVRRGVAVCLGDPVGDKVSFMSLVDDFNELCYYNDWLPSFVHIQDTHRAIYERLGFTLQPLGREAVVSIEVFQTEVRPKKYFRQIVNRFEKQGYTAELLSPPHAAATISRINTVSSEWLLRGGRSERGFAMGYFDESYLQTCKLMVVRDAEGVIQAFANQLPADFDAHEATYDLLRHSNESLGNVSDFLLVRFIDELQLAGYTRLNLGLCPLSGLEMKDIDERTGLIHALLRFAFANGDRFYSFSGLYRFKSKYQPEWRNRYVAYKGGVRGFSRSMSALMRMMRV